MIRRKILSAVMAAAVSLSAVTVLSVGVSAEWIKSESGYSYKSDDTGKKLTGWQTIGDGTYYFGSNGIARTGWKKIDGDTYYFNGAKKGKMLTGWATVGGSKYYFGSNGKMRTGFIKLSGNTYYFGTNGKMRTGKIKINGKVYDFGTDGILKSSSSSGSESKLNAPMKNLKWGMDTDEAVEKGGFKKYLVIDPMIMVYDSEPYVYYLFDSKDGLCAAGYAEEYSASALKTYKSYFTTDGWKLLGTYTEGSTAVIYQKGDQIGAIAYNDTAIMTMIFSEEYGEKIADGDVSSLDDMLG